MSKIRARKAAQDLADWLSNCDKDSRWWILASIGSILGALPGGEEFEDLVAEPCKGIGWKEFALIGSLFAAIDDKSDVEDVSKIVLTDEDFEDEGEEN